MEEFVTPDGGHDAWLSLFDPAGLDTSLTDLDLWLARRSRRDNAPPPSQASSEDGDGDLPCPEPVELILYVSSHSPHSAAAIRTIKKVLSRFERSRVRLTVKNLTEDPASGADDNVAFTPTLVRRSPSPRTFILGHMSNPNLLLDLLAECED